MGGPVIIGFAGRAGAGKSTAAAIVRQHINKDRGWFKPGSLLPQEIAFADPIRDMIRALTYGVMVAEAKGIQKETLSTPYPASPRTMLQTLGDWGRNLHPDFWVDETMRQIDEDSGRTVFLVSDVRFDNEARAIRQRGGKVVLITRKGQTIASPHRSEAGVSPGLIDATVSNDGSLDAFEDGILRLVEPWLKASRS